MIPRRLGPGRWEARQGYSVQVFPTFWDALAFQLGIL